MEVFNALTKIIKHFEFLYIENHNEVAIRDLYNIFRKRLNFQIWALREAAKNISNLTLTKCTLMV